jgi:hypothetical protein
MQSKTQLAVCVVVVVIIAIVSGSLWINLRPPRQQIADVQNQQSQDKISIPRSTSVPTPVPSPAIAAPTAPAVAAQLPESLPPPPSRWLPVDVQHAIIASLAEYPPGLPNLNQFVSADNAQERRRVKALAQFFAGNTEERRVEALAKSERIATAAVAAWNSALRLSPDQMQALNAITVAELRRETEDSLEIMSRIGSMDLVSASQLRVETVTRQHETLLRILEKATPQLTPEQSNMMSSMFEWWFRNKMLGVRLEEGLISPHRRD